MRRDGGGEMNFSVVISLRGFGEGGPGYEKPRDGIGEEVGEI